VPGGRLLEQHRKQRLERGQQSGQPVWFGRPERLPQRLSHRQPHHRPHQPERDPSGQSHGDGDHYRSADHSDRHRVADGHAFECLGDADRFIE
jgi:hypothetical protein